MKFSLVLISSHALKQAKKHKIAYWIFIQSHI